MRHETLREQYTRSACNVIVNSEIGGSYAENAPLATGMMPSFIKKDQKRKCMYGVLRIPANTHDQQILPIPCYGKKKPLQTAHGCLSLTKHRHSNIVFSWYWGLELCTGIQTCCGYVNFQIYRSYSWLAISNRSFCFSP